ncbi:MAG: hypothetical protein ABI557_12250 [Aureliella sp.]
MTGRCILLLTKDLFFVPTLRAAADKLECPLVVALSIDSDKLAGLATDEVAAWVVDLNCVPVDSIPTVVSSLAIRFPGANKIAFGPHVQTQRLAAAESAGCQYVLSRGQISNQIDRLMSEWTTGE